MITQSTCSEMLFDFELCGEKGKLPEGRQPMGAGSHSSLIIFVHPIFHFCAFGPFIIYAEM